MRSIPYKSRRAVSHLRCDGAALCWSASDARESVPAALCLGATTLSQDLDYWTATLLLGMIAQRRGIGAGTFERDAEIVGAAKSVFDRCQIHEEAVGGHRSCLPPP